MDIKFKITKNNLKFALMIVVLSAILTYSAIGVPTGPTITYAGLSNSSASTAPTIEGNTSIHGGHIATLLLVAKEQDDNWKAYVGNVSGTLVLEDSANYSIYEWPMATPTGEVYATRTATAVNWGTLVCADASHVGAEETEMGHTVTYTPTDSISDTFVSEANDHWGFTAGSSTITANSCGYSINPWINDTTQSVDQFEEVLLYDGTNILYTAKIENDFFGYHKNYTYDFQMLVAENASPGASRTDYYFYVELV